MTIHPVILSGGSGTRLWPLSREHYPKPLLPLLAERSLLQDTVCRMDGLPDVASPIFVCNEEHRFLIAEQIRQIGKSCSSIILEPTGRNTAPALTVAALYALDQDADAVLLAMPADHIIRDLAAFHNAVQHGALLAAAGRLVTFGTLPVSPETGYGYIRKGAPEGQSNGSDAQWYGVAKFVEKPDAETAAAYLASGEYLWNSGIFMMLASRWLDELQRFRPDIVAACQHAYQDGRRDGDFLRVAREAFEACPSDSIDYAVMEKTDHACVVPLDAGWSDVGTWSSLSAAHTADAQGNVIRGDVYAHDTRNSLLLGQHRFIGAVGVDNLIVVETADAVLVAHKGRAQEVKEIVEQLKRLKRDEYKFHRKVYRPWGAYEGIDAGSRYQVKRLSVNPGASLSLQMHHHRAEHWIVVKGTARVTREDEVFILYENQSTYIPCGAKHRLENPGSIPLEIVEVQSGSYLGEDDIIRFADVYDRCAPD